MGVGALRRNSGGRQGRSRDRLVAPDGSAPRDRLIVF